MTTNDNFGDDGYTLYEGAHDVLRDWTFGRRSFSSEELLKLRYMADRLNEDVVNMEENKAVGSHTNENVDFYSLNIVYLLFDLTRVLAQLESQSELLVGHYFTWSRENKPGKSKESTLTQARTVIGDIEAHTRKLRDYVSRLNADVVFNGLMESEYDIADLGFEGYVGEDTIQLSIPYDWANQSAKFLFQPRNSMYWKNLRTPVDVWHHVIGLVLKKLAPCYTGKLPMGRAKITIRVDFPFKRFGDPDHFWFRPVLDALVQNAFLSNDDSECVRVETQYRFNKQRPMITIVVQNETDAFEDIDVTESLQKVL